MRHEHLGHIFFKVCECIKTFVHEPFGQVFGQVFGQAFSEEKYSYIPANEYIYSGLHDESQGVSITPKAELIISNYYSNIIILHYILLFSYRLNKR